MEPGSMRARSPPHTADSSVWVSNYCALSPSVCGSEVRSWGNSPSVGKIGHFSTLWTQPKGVKTPTRPAPSSLDPVVGLGQLGWQERWVGQRSVRLHMSAAWKYTHRGHWFRQAAGVNPIPTRCGFSMYKTTAMYSRKLPGGQHWASSLRALLTGSSQQSSGGGSSTPLTYEKNQGLRGPAEAGTAEVKPKGATTSEGRMLGNEPYLPEPLFLQNPEPFLCVWLWGLNKKYIREGTH